MKDSTFMGTEKISGVFRRLVIPSVLSQFVNLTYNMVDRIFIGHIPDIGAGALTGVGLCTPAIIIIAGFQHLGGLGGGPRVSFFMGQGDNRSAEDTMGSCAAFLLVIGIVLTVLASIFCRQILMLFGASENTLPYAMDYFSIYVLGTVFALISGGLAFFISAQGFSTDSMISVFLGTGLNIVLDPVFIYVLDMGVKGAAIATVISQFVSAVWVIAFLTGKRTVLRLTAKSLAPRAKLLLPAVALGISPFTMQSTDCIMTICFNRSLLRYGGDLAVGALAVFTTIMHLVTMPLTGMTHGAQPIISYNYGAGNNSRVWETFKLLEKTCIIFSAAMWLFIMLFPDFFIHIFAEDVSLVTYSRSMIRIYFAMMWILSVQYSCQDSFLALGNAKTSFLLSLLRKIILLIPLIFILPLIFKSKVEAVFLAEPVADTLATMTTFTLFMVQYRKKLSGK